MIGTKQFQHWPISSINIPTFAYLNYLYQFFRATDNHAPILRSIQLDAPYECSAQNFQLTCPRLERASSHHCGWMKSMSNGQSYAPQYV